MKHCCHYCLGSDVEIMKANIALAVSLCMMLAACGGGGSAGFSAPVSSLPAARAIAAGAARPAVRPLATAAPIDWDTFGFNLQRTGYNPDETVVGPGNVGTLQQLWTVNVGAKPVREPVLASSVKINGTLTNVLYAGSSFGAALEAINAKTGAVIWTHKVAWVSFNCGTSATQFSVGGTPAIDRANNRIYFGDGQNRIHALDLSTGKQVSGWPVDLGDYSGGHNNIHGGLTYNPANGMLYVVTSSICDYTPWHGRIVAIDTATPAIVGKFFTVSGKSTAGGSGGGIWGGGGASIEPYTNDVLIATGNADASTGIAQNTGYAEHVVKLSPDLSTVVQSNYPANMSGITGLDDLDFGSTPVIFEPPGCPRLTVALNKSGILDLYDNSSIDAGPIQYIAMSEPEDNGDFQGEIAYDPVTNYVYVEQPMTYGIYLPGVAAFEIRSNCTLKPQPVWSAQFGPDGSTTTDGTPRSSITIANGVLYIANGSGDTEFAFNAATGAQLWSVGLTSIGKAGTVVANGIVYVTANDGTITAWAPSSEATALRNEGSVPR
jgi:outer membrane protein assembly factor BamB